MGAIDAFHVKQVIWETLHTAHFHRFADIYSASLRGEALVEETVPMAEIPDFVRSGDAAVAREVRVARMSETFYVAPLMSRLVTAAAESWPEDEPVLAEDWPTTHGFMYIPGGVSTVDVRGQVNVTEIFTWEVRGSQTEVVWWTNKKYDAPVMRERIGWDQIPQYTPWHIVVLKHGRALPQAMVMGTVIPPEVGREMRWITGPNGERSLYFPQGWTPEQLHPHLGVDRVSAWLVSALRIMQQPLAAVERKGMPANLRKSLMRHPVRLKQKAVTVIDFRRRVGDFEHVGEREYSHRFLRRGHWRRQQYKRDDGEWDRRRIWIHSTIVGDPSKPLILREHVNALTR